VSLAAVQAGDDLHPALAKPQPHYRPPARPATEMFSSTGEGKQQDQHYDSEWNPQISFHRDRRILRKKGHRLQSD